MSKSTNHYTDTAKTLKDACRSDINCGIMVYTNKGPNDCGCPFGGTCECHEVTTTMWKKVLKEMNAHV